MRPEPQKARWYMCLLILQQVGARTLPEKHMRAAWARNHDGSGYAFVADGKLVICKPYWKLRDLIRDYRADHKKWGASSPFIVHFRWTTHGENTKANCHPFSLCGGRIAMGHNGVLHGFDPVSRHESDTSWFARTMMAHRSADQVMSSRFCASVEKIIGDGNKLAFIRDDGTWRIVNEDAGEWNTEHDTWYSNDSYNPPSRPETRAYDAWLRSRNVAIGRSVWDHGDGSRMTGRGTIVDATDDDGFRVDEFDDSPIARETRLYCDHISDDEVIAAAQMAAMGMDDEVMMDLDALTPDQWRLFHESKEDALTARYYGLRAEDLQTESHEDGSESASLALRLRDLP